MLRGTALPIDVLRTQGSRAGGEQEPGCSKGNLGALTGTEGAVGNWRRGGRALQAGEDTGQMFGGAAEIGVLVSMAAVTKCHRPGGSLQKLILLRFWMLEVCSQQSPRGSQGGLLGAHLSDSGAAGNAWCITPTSLHPHVAFSLHVCPHKAFSLLRVCVCASSLPVRTQSSSLVEGPH